MHKFTEVPGDKNTLRLNCLSLYVKDIPLNNIHANKILKINEAVSKQIDWVNELTHKTSFPKQLQVNLPCNASQIKLVDERPMLLKYVKRNAYCSFS